ncbi:uncharacterized protein LOC114573679 [Perca flavescens]|uniref:uncharacterized protein LOC114573679 n=1 Tax=Perca flavescens TaxID=8167 RepID=UPI00106E6607|nr:uncharacterized protein LOC114573679 [Perca flavescens]
MGHDLRVHRDFYRQTDKTFQIAKISKLLFAMEQGASTFKGKNLDTIDPSVCGTCPTSTSESVPQRERKQVNEVDEDGGSDFFSPKRRLEPLSKDGSSGVDDQSPGKSLVLRPSQKKKRCKKSKTVEAMDGDSDLFSPKRRLEPLSEDGSTGVDDQSPGKSLVLRPSQKKKRCKKSKTVEAMVPPIVKVKRPWSEAERSAVNKHMAKFIAERRVPGKEHCM